MLDAKAAGLSLAHFIQAHAQNSRGPLQFAVVHPYSGHNLELRYWLEASGIKIGHDIEIIILPPTLMPDALLSGQIDGFCVGEPLELSVAIAKGAGKIITAKSAIWASSPEKVLAVQRGLGFEACQSLHALIRALYHASLWCGKRKITRL